MMTVTTTAVSVIQELITTEAEIIRGKGRRKTVSFNRDLEKIKYFRKSDPVMKIKYTNGTTTPTSNSSPSNSDTESGSDKETDPIEYPSPIPEAISGLTTKQLLSRGSHFVEQFSIKEYSIRSQACNILPFCSLIQKVGQNMVVVDGLSISSEQLEGSVAVKNVSYFKKVYIHYTTDDWKTSQDVQAKYHSSDLVFGIDRFSFSVDLKKLLRSESPPVLHFAVKYLCDQGEFWDNNSSQNYRVDFVTQRHTQSACGLEF